MLRKFCSLCSHPSPLALTNFPAHLPRKSLSLTRMGYDVSFKAEHAAVSCSLCPDWLF